MTALQSGVAPEAPRWEAEVDVREGVWWHISNWSKIRNVRTSWMPPRSKLTGMLKVGLWILVSSENLSTHGSCWNHCLCKEPHSNDDSLEPCRSATWQMQYVQRTCCVTIMAKDEMVSRDGFYWVPESRAKSFPLPADCGMTDMRYWLICLFALFLSQVNIWSWGSSFNYSFSFMHITFLQKWAKYKIVNKYIIRKFNTITFFLQWIFKSMSFFNYNKIPGGHILGTYFVFLFLF